MLNLKERGFQLEPSLQRSLANPSTFPRLEFEELVQAQRAERHARGFTCWGQFIAKLLCQVSIPRQSRAHRANLEFGGSPKCVEQEQKILVFVRSCKWTSRPITASYFVRAIVDTVIIGFPCCKLARSADYHTRFGSIKPPTQRVWWRR